MNEYKFSLIIPAYNEGFLITSTLKYLLNDDVLNNIEILVVCNGCKDDTVSKVNCFRSVNQLLLSNKAINLAVMETSKASKTNALNLGINTTQSKVKVFLDADIHINGKDIEILVQELRKSNLKAISPKVKFLFKNSSFLVRQYYQVARQSKYNTNNRLSNVIALSPCGLDRIGILPEIIADDEYIRRKFSPSEYAVAKSCFFQFICPKTLISLMQVLTRVERGNIQLESLHYPLGQDQLPSGYNELHLLSFPIFIMIKVIVKIRARIQLVLGKVNQWERDESNR